MATDYLYKDILEWENIQKSDKLTKILEYLALQIGGMVSHHNIATKLEISPKTVEKYIDLLEKAFVIFRLRAFSRNQASEIAKSFKIYFWDLGIRNSLIRNFTTQITKYSKTFPYRKIRSQKYFLHNELSSHLLILKLK